MRKDIIMKKIVCSKCDGTGGLVCYRKDGKGIEHFVCDSCNGKGMLFRRVTIEFLQIDEENRYIETQIIENS